MLRAASWVVWLLGSLLGGNLMPTPEPNSPWYQFSLRSLLLFTLFVAVPCSIGICTHWLVSAAIGWTVMIGGIAGRIVAGTRLGFAQGVVFAIQFLLWSGVACLFIPFLREAPWRMGVTLGLAVLVGGIVGGCSVGPRPR